MRDNKGRRLTSRLLGRVKWEIHKQRVPRNLSHLLAETRKSSSGPVILFFIPEAAVIPHFALSCILAKTLQELGHKVVLAGCFDLFKRCPAKAMTGLALHPTAKIVEQRRRQSPTA